MSKKTSDTEGYGYHSNFRYQRDPRSPRFPVIKWLLIVIALFSALSGYDRWRRYKDKGDASSTSVLEQADIRSAETAQSSENAPAEEVAAPAKEERAVPMLSVEPSSITRPPEPSPAPTTAENAEVVITYTMDMKPGSNSFMGRGRINGTEVALLADTGASMVVIPIRVAQRLSLKVGQEKAFKTGGGIVPHYATMIDKLSLGPIELHDVEAAINPAMQEDFVLLGMSALKLMEMEVDKGKRLVLKYKPVHAADDNMRTVDDENFKRSSRDCVSARGNKFDQQALDCLRGK
jgi:clan AA aspartic protease (TIGR02281 family)